MVAPMGHRRRVRGTAIRRIRILLIPLILDPVMIGAMKIRWVVALGP